ncbi:MULTISPECIES: thiamine-phosphate kinase [Gracilimonas]|uniref:Thiamine-monophosphate kinase n=1 Tax=Gracilimonas sediminicola TaxID=2952158 RepID=A0A9X2L5V2_9BACT|nr:thiamine-phosphate kinase [Gracilimonas sediminicola]MCP9292158.1 thiamine-phosphate kinase [Gracilimonas sediminicola]
MSEEFQTIQSIGSKGLLEKISNYDAFKNEKVTQSIGDDAAVIKEDGGNLTLLSSDTYVEGVDFDPTYTPFNHLGYKILSAGVSDIYAMNGKPEAVLVNLAVPNRMSVQMVEDLYQGIYAAGKLHEVEVVGGDLKANHANLVVSISVYGKVDEEHITYRKGANEGDAICITGDLGGALAGLRILMREKKFWEEHGDESIQPELGDYQFVVKRQLVPEARKDLVDTLREQNFIPTSMIDITKGLVSEVNSISEASDLGAYIYQAALPIAIETRQVADEMQEDVDRYALFGGEDLELMFTLSEEKVEEFVNHFNDFVVIGRMVPKEEGMKMQTAEGDVVSFDDLS